MREEIALAIVFVCGSIFGMNLATIMELLFRPFKVSKEGK